MKSSACSASVALLLLAGLALGENELTSKPAAYIAGNQWPETISATRRVKQIGVPNFGKLNKVIWRSGQPRREGYRRLAALGLKTVVNLCEEYPQDREIVPAGVMYVYI